MSKGYYYLVAKASIVVTLPIIEFNQERRYEHIIKRQPFISIGYPAYLNKSGPTLGSCFN